MLIFLPAGPSVQNSEEGEEMENDIEENAMDDDDDDDEDNEDESRDGSEDETFNEFERNVLEDNIPEPGPEGRIDDKGSSKTGKLEVLAVF